MLSLSKLQAHENSIMARVVSSSYLMFEDDRANLDLWQYLKFFSEVNTDIRHCFLVVCKFGASAAWMTFYHHGRYRNFLLGRPLGILKLFPADQELQRKVLTAKPVKAWNKPNWDSLREGVNALIASLIATIITLTCLVWLFYAAAPEGIEESQINNAVTYQVLNTVAALISAGMTGAKFNQPITEVLSEQGFEPLVNAWFIVFWLWVASVLLLYQFDLWTRRRRAAKQERRSQNSSAPAAKQKRRSPAATNLSAPNPIEQGLNQLSADAGATRMRPVRPAAPEVADWYVFRSGKAEGPYTALQLWEIQKITARTKVKRGESEWQRAGEISELEKYLSEK